MEEASVRQLVITPTVGLTIVITKAPRGRITGTGRWGFKWGANWDDSPDIMDTWVPFPNVSLPATPPDSHCRWHHYRNSLALSPILVEEALVSHKDWRITLCRVRPSALLCWDFVSGVFSPFLLPHPAVMPWDGGCDLVEQNPLLRAGVSWILSWKVQDYLLIPASWFLRSQPKHVSGALRARPEDIWEMSGKNHLGSYRRKYLGSTQHLKQRRISCQCPPLPHSTYLAGHSLWSLFQRLAC